MRIDRLFHVLVMGGAALGLAACDKGSGAGSEGGETTGPANGGTGGATTAGGGGSGGAVTTSEGGGSGGTTDTSSGSGTTGDLLCSEVPDPGDPCGCPCCWITDCLNTEPCCETFCASGNAGLGCCGG